jgi:ketosteroid isomerase-like protein
MTDKQQIVDLETRFWRVLQGKDPDAAKAMIASNALVTGPSGAMRIDPETFAEQTRDNKWRLDQFEFTDVDVIVPNENVGIIIYKVHQTGELKGKPMDMKAADSSVWVREGGEWKCALHTETILQPQKQPEPEPA